MPSANISISAEVEQAIGSYCQERLLHVFESLLLSFLHFGFSPKWHDLYDQAFLEIMKKLRDADLRRACERLASTDADIPKTLTFIARSADQQVAAAGLKHPLLPEQALIDAATAGSRPHLLAIASRKGIPARVIGAMLIREDPAVTNQLARNPDTAFSEIDYSLLVSMAARDKDLAALLCVRRDIPPELLSFVEMIMQGAR